MFRVVVRNVNKVQETHTFVARRIVLGGGRFMPLQKLLKSITTSKKELQKEIFRRHEFGKQCRTSSV